MSEFLIYSYIILAVSMFIHSCFVQPDKRYSNWTNVIGSSILAFISPIVILVWIFNKLTSR